MAPPQSRNLHCVSESCFLFDYMLFLTFWVCFTRLQLLTFSFARLVACLWSPKLYCDTVKNVTVSLPDEVYRKARIKAAERNVSLSSLVRRFLESLAEEEGEFKRLERLQEESYAKIERFTASDRVKREELYRNLR